MRGSLVIVRDCNGIPLVRRVWASDRNAVYISDELNFKKLLDNNEGLMPVRFPYQDVFQYDPALAIDIVSKPIDWRELKLWKNLAT